MIKIIESPTEYSRVIEYQFVVELAGHTCAGLIRSVSHHWEIECGNSIVWDTYHPNYPRLTEEEEQELITRLFDIS